MPKQELQGLQARFIVEYPKDLNGTLAAIRAGFSAKTAASQASRLLKNVKVMSAIQEIIAASTQKAHLTVERIDQEIARLAFADLRKLYREDGTLLLPHEWPDDVAATVAGTEVAELWEGRGEDREQVGVLKKVKTWDKGNALTLAARRLGLLKDRTEVNVTISLESLIVQSMKPVKEIEG